MNSTERILEYCNLPVEESPDQPAPHNWPSKGHLKVENLVVSYAPELPPVLKGISFEALPGERVAIVGRTGAGKSSFSLALFRFIIASEGRIVIDDVDISTISVYDLRRRISIIPQGESIHINWHNIILIIHARPRTLQRHSAVKPRPIHRAQ